MSPTLHDYQLRAVDHLRTHDQAGLFMEMGLGHPQDTDHAHGTGAPSPASSRRRAQASRSVRLARSMALAIGEPARRQAALASGADIVVIGRDTIGDIPEGRFRTFVLDELSSFKSNTSSRFKMMARLTRQAEHVWGLTGTPSPNGYMDLWSQIYLLDRGFRLGAGRRIGEGITHYRDRYFVPGAVANGFVVSWDLRPGARERIDALLGDICLSFLAEDHLNRPEPLVNTLLIPNPVRGIYQELKKNLTIDMRLIGEDAIHTAANAAVLSGRLSQITAGFLYSDRVTGAPTRLHSEKGKALREIADGTGSPLLVGYRFLEELDDLRRLLPEAKTIDEVPDLQRSWNAGDVPVLLAHPQSIGHGLNMQKGPGHTVAWASLPWSLEDYLQFNGRLDRQGQAHRVTVHHLIMPGTVDEVIATALVRKESVQDALLRYLA
jgi:hypothetical protein